MGLGLIAMAQTLSFLVNYVSGLYPAIKDKVFLMALVGGTAMSYLFIHGTRLMLDATDSFWTSKIMTSVSGTLIFLLLAYMFNGEGLTTKNGVCVLLAFCIVLVQVFWR